MNYEGDPSNQLGRLKRIVQHTATELAPEITLYGSAEPRTLEIDPDEFSRTLDTRLQVEQAISDQSREGNTGLKWKRAKGLYEKVGDGWETRSPVGENPLGSEENETVQTIDRLLEERTDDRPIVALDFGGGLGLSWMRIAAQPEYRAAIKKGQLAMVVTNLGATPDPSPDEEGYSGIARSMNEDNKLELAEGGYPQYPDYDLSWVQENQGYVYYLDANALELAGMSIDLQNGNSLPLMGNVDIIYEKLSLGHSHVPDLALAGFGELLSEDGILHSHAATNYHLMEPEQFSQIPLRNGEVVDITEEYSYQRRLALSIGSEALQRQGFSYRRDDERNMGVFSRLPSQERAAA